MEVDSVFWVRNYVAVEMDSVWMVTYFAFVVEVVDFVVVAMDFVS